MNMQREVVVAGHIALDIIPAIEQGLPFEAFFSPGVLQQVGPAAIATGGCVLNTGLALHRLGVDARLVAKVGDDAFGRLTVDLVRCAGDRLDWHLRIVEGAQSSYTLALNVPGHDRLLLNYPGTNDTFGAEDVREDSLAGAAWFHFGYPPLMKRILEADGEELRLTMAKAKSLGLATSLDMSMPGWTAEAARTDWRKLLSRTLPYVDVFLPSIEEIAFMLRPERYEALRKEAGHRDLIPFIPVELVREVADDMLALGAKIAVIKMGERGLYMKTACADVAGRLPAAVFPDAAAWANRELWAPCYEANVVGTTGSGDCTIAGFIAAALQGRRPEQTLNFAVAVGACSVEARDATSAIVPWAQVTARVDAGWRRLQAGQAPEGFLWDDEMQLWRGARMEAKNSQLHD